MRAAVFTIQRNEPVFLSIWIQYYSRYFDSRDIYVINHKNNDCYDERVYDIAPNAIIDQISYNETFDHEWLRSTVKAKQAELLKKYDYVLFAEIDEIVWHPLGIDRFIYNLKRNVATCRGFEVVHHFDEEPALDLDSRPLLAQRKYGYHANLYNKTLISSIVPDWCWGFHNCPQQVEPSENLYLIHLHKMDFEIAWQRNLSHRHTLLEKDITDATPGVQNVRQKQEWLRGWWYLSVDDCDPAKQMHEIDPVKHIEIPEQFKKAI